ncbi:MAG: hypothetical protein LBC91_05450 [Candidatus Accumulibacter sp.]|jgi:hypothetical protein|nr:hypothetical protein [Accumulibacter sp.]
MNQQELYKAKNPDLRASLAAMHRAAELARRTAMQTNTAIIVMRDGKLVRIPAEKLCEEETSHEPGLMDCNSPNRMEA